MRAGFAVSVVVLGAVVACGNGVGHPIVERDAVTSSGGTAGAPSGAGMAPGGRSGSGPGGREPPGGRESFGGRGFDGPGPVGGRYPAWGGFTGTGVPPGDYCARVAEWPVEAERDAEWLLELVNSTREFGNASCAAGVPPGVAGRLEMTRELNCAARLHALDMAERGFFGHVNPEGVGPEDRMRRAGQTFRIGGESIARGRMPTAAFETLFAAGGSECENLLDPRFNWVGIGKFYDFWVLDFAGP